MKPQGQWFGHPKGLYILFFTEMWERFSYYGMRALLVLYMVEYLIPHADQGMRVIGYGAVRHGVQALVGLFGIHALLTTQALSSQIYGLYTGFVYFTPFFGGILADKIFGQRKTVYVGGVLMAIGHFLMAVPSLFFPALLFLIVGNGCFKPNISTQVGLLYPEGDHRRDSAFTIFYMGINLGAIFSPLICGTLGQVVGWHWGFGAAGVGMLAGLGIYHFGRHLLPMDELTQKAAAEHLTVAEEEKKPLTPAEW
ncbi:MAG: peptide MFS transporter, partial [Elusimicrobia bacterium]|nr:peptide MFS transporter [Elusimicrobiota bacterium]